MAGRSRATFEKRRKEMARLEKQKEKAERRKQRKETTTRDGSGPEMGEPLPPLMEQELP